MSVFEYKMNMPDFSDTIFQKFAIDRRSLINIKLSMCRSSL